jgi:ribosomal-protein-alanine N-acetyltransferase
MIGFLRRLFTRGEPALSEAGPRDAGTIATLHGASFRRGWSELEVEALLPTATSLRIAPPLAAGSAASS